MKSQIVVSDSKIRVEDSGSYIFVGFEKEADAKEFKDKCPKYLKADYHFCKSPEWSLPRGQYGRFENMYRFSFQVNEKSNIKKGASNDSASKRRNKVMQIIEDYK